MRLVLLSIAQLIMSFFSFGFVGLWVCGFLFGVYESMRLCVVVFAMFVYICAVVRVCGYVVVCLCVIVRLWI